MTLFERAQVFSEVKQLAAQVCRKIKDAGGSAEDCEIAMLALEWKKDRKLYPQVAGRKLGVWR